MLADSLLSDLEVYDIIDVLNDRNESKLESMTATFYEMYDTYSGCCCSPEQQARNLTNITKLRNTIEDFVHWSGNARHTLESSAICAADSIVQEMVNDYMGLEESHLIFPAEHALYVDSSVTDLTEWVRTYIRKHVRDNLREDFLVLVIKPILDSPDK